MGKFTKVYLKFRIKEAKQIILKHATKEMLKSLWCEHRLILAAAIGLLGAIIFTFGMGREIPSPVNQLRMPSFSPYPFNICGTGFVEANTQNIGVGAYTSGIVSEVLVTPGNTLKKGDPLFIMDRRSALADLGIKQSELNAAQAKLEVAQVKLAESCDFLKRAKGLKAGYSISQRDLIRREFEVQQTKAQVKLQKSQVAQAKAHLEAATLTLSKLTVCSPVDGLIMKVNVRPGEYISQLSREIPPLVLIGNIKPLYVRVQIDENDAWRLNEQAKAHAYVKSNQSMSFSLKPIRIEPYAQPKTKLSGDSAELIDTRIVECLYEITADPKNIYVGQQLGVFIEAEEEP